MSKMCKDKISNKRKLSDDNSKERRRSKCMNKEFVPRNSLLTDLYQINHIRTIYNIFIAFFIVLFLATITHDYLEKGEIHLGLKTVIYSFGKFLSVLRIWISMKISTFILYAGFCFWSRTHVQLPLKSLVQPMWDYGCLLMFILYQALFMYFPAKFLAEESIPPASSFMLLMEQVRMMMKTYAFVRSNAPRVLTRKPADKLCPEFSKFLYFLFAPTLIYRDEYPRTKSINWGKVLWSLTEVVVTVFYAAFMFEHFIIPPFEKYGLRIFEPRIATFTLFSMMLPGMCIFLFGFYCILHSWQNATAELLGFADRLFYKDWWNCTSYSTYYRHWNIIVQDWLYNYVYRDTYDLSHNRAASIVSVFFVSAIFHEYIMAFALRFFYPVMMILFGVFGMLLIFVTERDSKAAGNLFLWFGLLSGNGILVALYSMEYYARLRCPPYDDELLDLFLPRSWICYGAQVNNASSLYRHV